MVIYLNNRATIPESPPELPNVTRIQGEIYLLQGLQVVKLPPRWGSSDAQSRPDLYRFVFNARGQAQALAAVKGSK